MLHPSNDIIMNAQQFFAADQSEANLVKLLHAVSIVLQEGAEVLILLLPMRRRDSCCCRRRLRTAAWNI
mgnify:CR=1 FL=1